MKRGIFYALLSAFIVGAIAFALVASAFTRPRQMQRLLFAARWFAPARSNAEIVAQVNQAVVTVIATRDLRQQQSAFTEALIPQQNATPNPPPEANVQRGTGTGFVIDSAGFIVTNDHVIRGADRIRVRLTDGRERRAVVYGTDAATDLALLKIEAEALDIIALGDSDEVRVGDSVIAIGNPLDYEHSVTAGIVSAKGRKVYNNEPFEDFIQTDAAINRGNSGGPLLSQTGEVIGVNTVIRVDGSGISFAVPSNVVKRVIAQLRLHRTVSRGYLGLTPADLTPEFREGLTLGNTQGILVADIVPERPGAKAGLEIYDVVTHFDGRAVVSADAFYHLVANTPPPRKVALTVLRAGRTLQLSAILEERDKEDSIQPAAPPVTLAKTEPVIGFSVREQKPEISSTALAPGRLDLPPGEPQTEQSEQVVVADVDPLGPAADSGLTKGQVILEINRQPVRNVADFNHLTAALPHGSVLIMRVSAPQQRVIRLVAVRVGGD
jgi:serine protease Do